MNEEIFRFLDDEILHASADHAADRVKKLRAIRGYLAAAKELRASFDTRRGGEYHCIDERRADRFDLDCARVAF